MAINLVPESLLSPEEEQAKMAQTLNATRARQGGQQVNLPQQKGVLSQVSDMAREKVIGDAVNTGSQAMYDKGAAMFASKAAPATMAQMAGPALTTAGGAGLGAGMGPGMAGVAAPGLAGAGAATGAMAAMPYVGAGLLAGKALGFFNNGGHVGPLYASQGSKTPEGKSIADQIKYIRDKEYYDALEQADNEMHRSYYKSEGGNIGPLYAADGFKARTHSMPQHSIGMYTPKRKEEAAKESEDNEKSTGFFSSLFKSDGGQVGPLSKLKYKSAGGEVYELSYGGGPLKKEK